MDGYTLILHEQYSTYMSSTTAQRCSGKNRRGKMVDSIKCTREIQRMVYKPGRVGFQHSIDSTTFSNKRKRMGIYSCKLRVKYALCSRQPPPRKAGKTPRLVALPARSSPPRPSYQGLLHLFRCTSTHKHNISGL